MRNRPLAVVLNILLSQKFFSPFLSSLRSERSAPEETVLIFAFAPNDLLLRRLCIPRGNSGTSHSALGSQWLIPLHLISGRPRPLLSPFEHSSLGTPYEKIANNLHILNPKGTICKFFFVKNLAAPKIFRTFAAGMDYTHFLMGH